MTPEQRQRLADHVVARVKTRIAETSLALGDGAHTTELLAPALELATEIVREIAPMLLPVRLNLLPDHRSPDNPRRVLVEFTGPLFDD